LILAKRRVKSEAAANTEVVAVEYRDRAMPVQGIAATRDDSSGHQGRRRTGMKVAPFDENAFKMDHPRGTVSFNYILMGGEPEKLENFRYILGRQEADFHMPRHRHS
jgi:hypothetical protein